MVAVRFRGTFRGVKLGARKAWLSARSGELQLPLAREGRHCWGGLGLVGFF